MPRPVHHHPLIYRLMVVEHALRDLLHPPEKLLEAAGMRPGMTLLDFGCGPGGFCLAAARIVGPGGRVVAVDINPLALESVRRRGRRRGFGNLCVLHGDTLREIGDGTVDLALLYDALHEVQEPAAVLVQIARVLSEKGVLFVRDRRLSREAVIGTVTKEGRFRQLEGEGTGLRFVPAKERMI